MENGKQLVEEMDKLRALLPDRTHRGGPALDPLEVVEVEQWHEKRGTWLPVGRFHRYFADGLLTCYSAKMAKPRRIRQVEARS